MVERVTPAASVRDGDVEQAEVGVTRGSNRTEANLATVVVTERLLNP